MVNIDNNRSLEKMLDFNVKLIQKAIQILIETRINKAGGGVISNEGKVKLRQNG